MNDDNWGHFIDTESMESLRPKNNNKKNIASRRNLPIIREDVCDSDSDSDIDSNYNNWNIHIYVKIILITATFIWKFYY